MPESIEQFYRKQMPDVWESRQGDIERLGIVAAEIYRTNFFPEMNVNWRTYPDNIGHKIFPGCFRCHEGRHVDSAGIAISHECSVCHVFPAHGTVDPPSSYVQTAGFVHPTQLEGSHATIRCDRCHTGGVAPASSCEGCHSLQHEFRSGTLSAFSSLGIARDSMHEPVSCEACHDLTQPTDIQTIDAMCMDCHEDEEERFEGMLESWSREVERLINDAEPRTDDRGRQLLETLRKAGPLHNIEATRLLVRSVTGESEPSRTPEP